MWIPTTTDLKITVGGVDISAYVPRSSGNVRGLPGLSVNQAIGAALDTCTIGVENGGALSINEWDEVTVTNAAATMIYFGGHVTGIADKPYGPEVDLVLTCQDYGVRFERAIYNGEWKNSTPLATVLATIKADAWPALTEFNFATYVASLGSLVRLRSPRMTVRDLLDEIASRFEAEWYVDYSKNLHMFYELEDAAPYAISDSPNYSTSYPCEDLMRTRNGIGMVNRVTVVGGAYLSADVAHEYAGDGQQVRFVVPHYYHAQAAETSVIVEINDGSDGSPSWTTKTLGIKYLDDNVAKDVYFAFQEKFFEFTSAPPLLKRSWRVKARYEAPLRVVVSDSTSYAALGFYLDAVLVDDTIRDKAEARTVGLAYLAEHSNTTILTGSVVEPGLRAGQTITVTNSKLGISAVTYLIRSLTMTFPGGGAVRYNITIGDYSPDLYAMLRDLKKKKEYEWREDEVLDILEQWTETMEFTTESLADATSTGPYYLSNTPAEAMEFGGTGAWG